MDPKDRIKEFIEYVYGIDLLDIDSDIDIIDNIEDKELQES